jgi:hypothetical protein
MLSFLDFIKASPLLIILETYFYIYLAIAIYLSEGFYKNFAR